MFAALTSPGEASVYMFHQSVRSLTKDRLEPLHSGCTTLSPGPPATCSMLKTQSFKSAQCLMFQAARRCSCPTLSAASAAAVLPVVAAPTMREFRNHDPREQTGVLCLHQHSRCHTLRLLASSPVSVTSATHSSVSSHGMFGWSQQIHASCSRHTMMLSVLQAGLNEAAKRYIDANKSNCSRFVACSMCLGFRV